MDSDHDGLPDWWEIQHFGNLSHNASDLGQAGVSLGQCYAEGRNPKANEASTASTNAQVALTVYSPGF